MNSEEKLIRTISEDTDSPYPICTPVARKSLCLLPQRDLPHPAVQLSEKLKKLQSEYNMTSRSPNFLKKILQMSSLPRNFKDFPMEKILLDVAKELLMSELEITIFSIYLNRFLFQEGPQLLLVNLYILGLASKTYFLEDIEALALTINEKIVNFIQYFNVWMTRNDLATFVSVQELNRAFEALASLSNHDVKVEYNFYVDSILESAPASVYEKPVWLEQVVLNVEDFDSIPEQPVLKSMDSLFSIIGEFKELPLLAAGISIASNGAFDYIWGDR
jgi:hypothetical protein